MKDKEITMLEAWSPRWKLIFTQGAHGYWEHSRTGERKYSVMAGYSGLNKKWLKGEK